MSAKPSFFAELQRRNVYKIGAMYAVSGWLIVQIVTQVFPIFHISELVQRIIVLAIVAGFPMVLVLSWIYELTPQGIVKTDEVTPSASVTRSTGQKLNRAIIAVLSVAVLVLLAKEFWPHAGGGPATAGGDKSIAVLPLANESGDKDQQYFSDGLSEDFINALSQIAGLKVISRNSSFQFRDSKEDAKAIGAKLGVARLLEGSVRRVGEVVRISAELVDAEDDSTLWSQQFDRPYADLFKLQDEVTAAVAAALKARLVGETGTLAQSERPASGNLEAYKAYLQGKFYGERANREDDQRGLDYFSEAVRLDPRYAQAYTGLCGALTNKAGNYTQGAESRQAYDQARVACDTALSLDPDLALAHSARSWLLMTADRDWQAAETEARRALQLAPNDGDALSQLAVLLGALGRPAEAIQTVQQSMAVDPLKAGSYDWCGRYLTALGRLPEAEQAARKAVELEPAAGFYYNGLVIIEILRGEAQAALQDAQRPPDAAYRTLALAFATQAGTDRAAADQALQKLIEDGAGDSAYQIAQIYALRKQPDQAFVWLDRAYANRDPGLTLLMTDPFLKAYRDDPRYAAFRAKLGLPAAPEK